MAEIQKISKQIKIKTGVIKRLRKEKEMYSKEIADLEAKKSSLISQNAEDSEWYIGNSTKMIEESKKMIGDSTTRCQKAVAELQSIVSEAKLNELMEVLLDARKTLETVDVEDNEDQDQDPAKV